MKTKPRKKTQRRAPKKPARKKTAAKATSKKAAPKKAAPKNASAKTAPTKTAPVKRAAPVAAPQPSQSPSQLIDARIQELADWRGHTLSRVRALIKEAVPEVVEEWKWRGVPVWYRNGMLCTGETYKEVVKMTFAKGAALPDPSRLFNSSLEGNARRAIDIREGEPINEEALKALIRAAVDLNQSKA